jgi:hypothetical protein
MQNGSEGTYLDKFQPLGLGRTFEVPAIAPTGIILKGDGGPALRKLTVNSFLELRCGLGLGPFFRPERRLIGLE